MLTKANALTVEAQKYKLSIMSKKKPIFYMKMGF